MARQIIRDLFGTIKPNGYRQFNIAYVEIPKKMGKSELAAAVALHSLGQFIQDGNKILFETLLQVKEHLLDLNVPFDKDDLDSLNYLAGKSVDYVNKKACEGTIEAHVKLGKFQIY